MFELPCKAFFVFRGPFLGVKSQETNRKATSLPLSFFLGGPLRNYTNKQKTNPASGTPTYVLLLSVSSWWLFSHPQPKSAPQKKNKKKVTPKPQPCRRSRLSAFALRDPRLPQHRQTRHEAGPSVGFNMFLLREMLGKRNAMNLGVPLKAPTRWMVCRSHSL